MQIPRDVDLKKAQKSFSTFHKKIQTLKKSIFVKKVENNILTSKYDSQVKVLTLKPGINLIYRQNTMTPTFSMHAYLRGGISSETPATNGSYHLMSHLLTKGHNEISHDKMKKEIEDASASLVSFSGKNAYGITLHGQSKDFKNLASHLLGSLLSPDMLENKMKHEKEMMLRQIDAQKEDPTKQCFTRVSKLMFNNHPYALSAVGTSQNIKKFTRKSLLAIHNKNLKKEPLLITYCGDLNLEEVLGALAPHLEKISPRTNVKPKLKKYKPILGKKIVMEFNREQTQIFIGTPIVGRAEEEHLVFKMIAAHLSGMSSELFVEVRDKKGLCYSTQAIHFNAVEGGYFGIYMASGHEKVPLAIEAINEILTNLKKNGFTKEQFDRIKTMVEGQNQLALQTNDDYANIYSVPVLQHHGLDQFHANTKKIKEYDYETFQKQVKRLLSAKFSTVLVGKGVNKLI
jgi:zinc protease